jgi:hypothetical protein
LYTSGFRRAKNFEPDFGPTSFLKLEFGPLAKKVGHPWFKPLIIHK